MEATGERFISDEIWGYMSEIEHRHRYGLLSDVVRDKVVLDAACGTGYGTYSIAEDARKVIGIDISEEAIAFCKDNYQKDNLEYKQMSATEMKFEDNSFDVVISFETIEHLPLEAQHAFLAEIKRVLKDDGVLIMSSPNRDIITQIRRGRNNPYHIHEFLCEEFREFLKEYFLNVKFDAQNVVEVSWIAPERQQEDSANIMLSAHFDSVLPSYLVIAICSQSAKKIENIDFNSIYVPNIHQFLHEKYDAFRTACLYRDLGRGYIEEDKLEENIELSGAEFRVRFEFDASVVEGIRFDPCEHYCRITNLSIQSNCGANIKKINGKCKNGEYLFLTPDPIMELRLENRPKNAWLEITGHMLQLNEYEIAELYEANGVPAIEEKIDTIPLCYYDIGEGFNENHKLYGEYILKNGYYTVHFSLPQKSEHIRFDPAFVGGKCLKFSKILINGKQADFQVYNMPYLNNYYLTVKKFPYIVFESEKTEIELSIDFLPLSIQEMERYLESGNVEEE